MSGNSDAGALLDSNIVIDYFRRKVDLRGLFETHNIYLCDIVLGELFGGACKSANPNRNKQQVERLIPTVNILAKNIETTRIYGEIWATLAEKGEMIPTNDIWIAALGLQHGLKVITRDKHFEKVPNLNVEGWTQSPLK